MTALEYLINYVFEDHTEQWYQDIQLALKMEKQQIIDAYNEGYRDGEHDGKSNVLPDDIANYSNAEEYYRLIK